MRHLKPVVNTQLEQNCFFNEHILLVITCSVTLSIFPPYVLNCRFFYDAKPKLQWHPKMTKRRMFRLIIFVLDTFSQALLSRFNYLKKSYNIIYASKKSQKQFQQKKSKLT